MHGYKRKPCQVLEIYFYFVNQFEICTQYVGMSPECCVHQTLQVFPCGGFLPSFHSLLEANHLVV
jgi:hypothetical protein